MCILYFTSHFRGVITVTSDGRRHVALGRGYTQYSFPEREHKIEEYIAKVYEKRNYVCCNYIQGDTQNYIKV